VRPFLALSDQSNAALWAEFGEIGLIVNLLAGPILVSQCSTASGNRILPPYVHGLCWPKLQLEMKAAEYISSAM
jgi:hypothetical protein